MILVTGDAYVDSPHMGVAVIGRVLMNDGYRVGIIAQPDLQGPGDITTAGRSQTLLGGDRGRRGFHGGQLYGFRQSGRKQDDLTPGGSKFDRRPDRAVIAYSNLIRRHFKNHPYIVIGGIEASLRRISHYDAWGRCREAVRSL